MIISDFRNKVTEVVICVQPFSKREGGKIFLGALPRLHIIGQWSELVWELVKGRCNVRILGSG